MSADFEQTGQVVVYHFFIDSAISFSHLVIKVVKRLISMLITLFFIITITFVLMHTIPGGPFTGEKKLPPEIEAALNEKYHLNAFLYDLLVACVERGQSTLNLDVNNGLV